jgi:hypothetical protein
MPNLLYTELRGVVGTLLAQFGGLLTLVGKTGVAYTGPTDAASAGTTHTLLARALDAGSQVKVREGALSACDVVLLVAIDGTWPVADVAWSATWGGKAWRVVAWEALAPDGETTLYWLLGLRGGA